MPVPASAPSKSDGASTRERLVHLQKSNTLDEKRISLSRPPASLKTRSSSPSDLSFTGTSSGVRVPPIRTFRSSVARRSFPIDSATAASLSQSAAKIDDEPLETTDATTGLTARQRARQQRDEDGNADANPQIPQIMAPVQQSSRYDDEFADVGADPEDTCDVFLKIAREENGRTSSATTARDEAGFFSDDNQPRNQAVKFHWWRAG
ncbi:hypothetical protein TD95_001898 [Thielaviopsis punctulata]|uniref:Uncharacterized protein n=1 Tax=Thielaviopsis punctulata TaxID=72032 RepID=A0A0F4ZJD5_9PEZI|nr:hypothetical protein TD95_001898 [Thielaviopsis punctulata]